MQSGEINYDARDRNIRLQSEVTYGSIATCDVLRILKRYTNETLAHECKVINSVGYSSSQPSTFDSNVSRELAYCAGHAIHHYALISVMARLMDAKLPEQFGVAPSTVAHNAKQAVR